MKRLISLIYIFLTTVSLHSQEKRLALVIGNSAYEYGGVLKNPVNDAFSMTQALSEIGFEVLEHYNLNQGDMKKAIDDFGVKLKGYNSGLFFFAGHGIQVNGYNYLIPVDANLKSERYVEYDCVQADRVLANMDASDATVNIMILDACRNNPFERSWTRSTSGQGLAFMNAPSGTLIAYATAPGSTASDGEGINGLYTEALLENINNPDITVLQVFQNVRSIVSDRTGNSQVPWESTSLTGDYYLVSQQIQQYDRDNKSISTPPQIALERQQGISEITPSGAFVDERDGEEYQWERIGEQIWMAENLNYEFSDSWVSDTIYGRLYKWDAANVVCPEGWHLPSDEEWMELEMYLGMDSTEVLAEGLYRGNYEGGKIKEKGTTHWRSTSLGTTNETGFSALPGGLHYAGGGFGGILRDAYFWTSTPGSVGHYYFRRLNHRYDNIYRYMNTRNRGMSVRCVKNY